MSCTVLQQLLYSGEYDELEDVVIIEGEFVESDDHHNTVRQVILGMTPCDIIIAERRITNYKEHPEVYFLTEADPYMLDLEVSSVWPICLIRMENSLLSYELTIHFYDKTRYYELANTRVNGDLEDTWARWLERVIYLKEDPYGYIRDQFDEYEMPYPEYYASRTLSRDQEEENISKFESVKKKSKKKKKEKSTPDKDKSKKSKRKKWC